MTKPSQVSVPKKSKDIVANIAAKNKLKEVPKAVKANRLARLRKFLKAKRVLRAAMPVGAGLASYAAVRKLSKNKPKKEDSEVMKKTAMLRRDFINYVQEPTDNLTEAFLDIVQPLEKQADALGLVIPTALGLGAAGTAAYVGTQKAKSKAKLEALKEIKDRDKREIAEQSIEGQTYTKAAPAALAAGLGAAYLGGQHLSAEHLEKVKKLGAGEALKGMKGKEKVLAAPGSFVQSGLNRLGASSAQAKALTGAGVLGAGLLAGKLMSDKMKSKAYKDAGVTPSDLRKPRGQTKSAGLFLKPSDLADSHFDLAQALEGQLNGADQGKEFKKQAGKAKVIAGGTIGLAYEPLRQTLSKPVPQPPPQDPKGGITSRIKGSVARHKYKTDKWRREHPVTATLLSGVAGAGAGAATGLGTGFMEVGKSLKGKV